MGALTFGLTFVLGQGILGWGQGILKVLHMSQEYPILFLRWFTL